MTRTDLTDEDLADLVARTFRAQAARVRAPAEPFDPTARAGTDDVPGRRGRRRRGRRVGVAAAAAVVLVLAAGAVVARAGDDGRGRTRTQSSTATTPTTEASVGATASADAAPDGAWAPGWVPEDLTLWSVRWSTGPGAVAGLDNLQLFRRAAGGGVLVDIQPANPGSSSGGDPLTVRGLPATVMPAKEFPESSSTVFWHEDASLSATFTGMTVDEAVAVLDSLSWRSDDHQDGFAPPGDGSVELAAETEPDPGGAPVSTVEFVYADDALTVMPGESRQLTVRSTSAVGGVSRQTLLALLNGEGGPEADGAVRSYDPTYGTLQVVWPDGRQWWIDANASALTEDELAQVAAGMAPTSGEQLETMAAEAAARVEDLPVVAAATVGSGAEITVRGPDGTGMLLCLTPGDAGDERCADPFDETALAGGPGGPLVAHIVVDGRWFVVAATTGEPVTIPQSGTGDTSRPPSELEWRPGIAGETADDGTWRYLLAEVPADLDFVGLETPGIGMGMQVTGRPEA